MKDKKHIVAVTALIKNQDEEKFLVVKRHEDEVAYPGKWALPGGKLERGETVMETLKREVKEEADLEIENSKKFLKDYTFERPDGHNVVGLTFEVVAENEDVEISDDFDDYRWVTPEEFSDIDYIEGTEEEVQRAFGN
mgnify:CR=1 FL=1